MITEETHENYANKSSALDKLPETHTADQFIGTDKDGHYYQDKTGVYVFKDGEKEYLPKDLEEDSKFYSTSQETEKMESVTKDAKELVYLAEKDEFYSFNSTSGELKYVGPLDDFDNIQLHVQKSKEKPATKTVYASTQGGEIYGSWDEIDWTKVPYTGDAAGKLYQMVYAESNGKEEPVAKAKGNIYSMAVLGNDLYYNDLKGNIYKLGEKKPVAKAENGIISSMTVLNRNSSMAVLNTDLYYSHYRNIYRFGKAEPIVEAKDTIVSMAVLNNGVYYRDLKGNIYMLWIHEPIVKTEEIDKERTNAPKEDSTANEIYLEMSGRLLSFNPESKKLKDAGLLKDFKEILSYARDKSKPKADDAITAEKVAYLRDGEKLFSFDSESGKTKYVGKLENVEFLKKYLRDMMEGGAVLPFEATSTLAYLRDKDSRLYLYDSASGKMDYAGQLGSLESVKQSMLDKEGFIPANEIKEAVEIPEVTQYEPVPTSKLETGLVEEHAPELKEIPKVEQYKEKESAPLPEIKPKTPEEPVMKTETPAPTRLIEFLDRNEGSMKTETPAPTVVKKQTERKKRELVPA